MKEIARGCLEYLLKLKASIYIDIYIYIYIYIVWERELRCSHAGIPKLAHIYKKVRGERRVKNKTR
jgi:hypothetical protein